MGFCLKRLWAKTIQTQKGRKGKKKKKRINYLIAGYNVLIHFFNRGEVYVELVEAGRKGKEKVMRESYSNKKDKRANMEKKFWMTLKTEVNSQIRVDKSLVKTMQGFEWMEVQVLFASAVDVYVSYWSSQLPLKDSDNTLFCYLRAWTIFQLHLYLSVFLQIMIRCLCFHLF